MTQNGTQDVSIRGDTASLDIWYPSVNEVKYLRVGLMCVRAADDIRISYDYERDGWKIEQASRFGWHVNDPVCDEDWQEVSFVRAWARQESEEAENARIASFEANP